MNAITLIETECCDCGITFSIQENLYNQREEDGKTFYCPNGHGQHFTKSKASRIEELEEELGEVKKELEDTQIELRRIKCELIKYQNQPKNGLMARIFRGSETKTDL